MQSSPLSKNSAQRPASTLLFRQAASDGRDILSHEELSTLMASLELDFAPNQVKHWSCFELCPEYSLVERTPGKIAEHRARISA